MHAVVWRRMAPPSGVQPGLGAGFSESKRAKKRNGIYLHLHSFSPLSLSSPFLPVFPLSTTSLSLSPSLLSLPLDAPLSLSLPAILSSPTLLRTRLPSCLNPQALDPPPSQHVAGAAADAAATLAASVRSPRHRWDHRSPLPLSPLFTKNNLHGTPLRFSSLFVSLG